MSTLRISNIEAKSVPASATIDEKVKITNSSGDPLVFIDGKTSGITTVGINTTDPNITFDANSNVVVTGIITATKFSGQFEPTSVGIADSIFHTGDTNTAIRFPSADTITAETGGAERLRITSGGSIGIGTDNPQQDVHILRSQLSRVRIESTSTAYNSDVIFQNPDGLLGVVGYNASLDTINIDSRGGTGGISFTRTGSEKVRIASDGKIGIGISTPDCMLHVAKASAGTMSADGNAVLAIENNNHCVFNMMSPADKSSYIMMGDPDDINAGQIRYDNNVDRLQFEVNGSERLRIASDGVITAYEELILSNALPSLKLIDSANSQYAFLDGNSGNLILHSDKGNTGSSSTLKLAVDNSVKVTVDSSGDLEIHDGDLKVASGHGIDFSATSDGSGTTSSEILDEYEEGYYTPTATTGAGGNITGTTSFSLRYVKIGGLVHLFGRLHFSVSAFDVTSFSLSLPFTNSTANRHDTSSVMHLIRGNGGDPVQGIRIFRVAPGGTTMSMQNHEGQSNGYLGNSNPHLNVNFSYFSA